MHETKVVIDPAADLQVPNTSCHADETVTLLALKRAPHTLEDRTVIGVGEIKTSKLYVKGFETIAFSSGFTRTPSFFSQVRTHSGNDCIISRQRAPSTDGFQPTMQEEQADNLNHAAETVGRLAVEHGSGGLSTMDGQIGSSAQNVNGKRTGASTNSAFDTAPLAAAALAFSNGAIARVTNTAATGFDLAVQETGGQDRIHGAEDMSWIVVEAGTWGPADGTPLQAGMADIGSTARRGFASISFDAGFAADPAVLTQTQTGHDAAFAITRMQTVDGAGFSVALAKDEASGRGAHGVDCVRWIAVDLGTAHDADGFVFEAGPLRARDGAVGTVFDVDMADAGAAAGVAGFARLGALAAQGFDVHREENRSLNPETSHRAEDIAWLARDGASEIRGDALV